MGHRSLPVKAKTLPRCQVSVQYTQGRLGGHTLKFLQPMSRDEDSEPTLLCMECLKVLDSHSIKPSSLDAALPGPDGETISHEASANETDLFCSGNCRARFFGKRNGTSLRRQLFDLERGVCQKCGVDCHDLWQTLLTSSPERRKKKLEDSPRDGFLSAHFVSQFGASCCEFGSWIYILDRKAWRSWYDLKSFLQNLESTVMSAVPIFCLEQIISG